MMEIKSFYPFQNLLRVTQKFHEDKAIIKTKSFSFEHEFDFDYRDVVEITDAFKSTYNQITFSFYLLLAVSVLLALLDNYFYSHKVLLHIGQALYISGLLLLITGFKRSWYIYLIDKNHNTLTTIEQTRQNRELVFQILEMVKNKAANIREYSTAEPFPENEPMFEYVEYDISELSKITERFYENEIIGYRQSPFGESIYNIMYTSLSGKVLHGKIKNNYADWFFSISVLLLAVFNGFYFGFALPLHIHIPRIIFYAAIGLFVLSLILLPFNLIKREIVGLYNYNGDIEYSTHISKRSKDKVEKIIEFVQSKISAEEKAQILKET